MIRVIRSGCIVACLVVGLFACGRVELSENQIRDLAWQYLEPSTSSHTRSHWKYVEVKKVMGSEVAAKFKKEHVSWCGQDIPVEKNRSIKPSGSYWYIHLKPKEATPLPTPTISPTAPPYIPEPFISQALFLLDPADGRIVACKLTCVIY